MTAADPNSVTHQTANFYIVGPGNGSLSDPRGVWDMTLANTTRNSRVYVITSTPGGVSLEQIVTDGTTANASAPIMVGSIYAPGVSFGAVAGDETPR